MGAQSLHCLLQWELPKPEAIDAASIERIVGFKNVPSGTKILIGCDPSKQNHETHTADSVPFPTQTSDEDRSLSDRVLQDKTSELAKFIPECLYLSYLPSS